MSYFHRHRSFHLGLSLLVWALFLLGLSACRSGNPPTAPIVTPTVASPSSTAQPAVTEAIVATFTPTSAPSSAQVVLLALPGSDSATTASLQETLTDLSAQDGLSFETLTDLAELQLSSESRLVVALPPDPGLANLAAANPSVQFLAVGFPEMEVASNLSTIGAGGDRSDQQGFLAGYLAAVITQDWRVGVISQSSSPAGNAARNGFINGVIFYCGLCRPAYPPFIQYPIFSDLSPGADPQTAVDTLVNNAVKTVYVAPGTGDAALLQTLAQAGMQIIGSGDPPPEAANQWVASISVDQMGAVRQIWPSLLAGEGGLNFSTPLALSQRNANLFSIGRQRLVDKMLTDLLADYVDTGVDPQTGEMR